MRRDQPRGTDLAAQDLQGGARPRFGTRWACQGFPAYSPVTGASAGAFRGGSGQECAGAILWEPPSPGDLRGHQWAQSPEEIRGRAAPGKRRGSQLADESLTKRRKE